MKIYIPAFLLIFGALSFNQASESPQPSQGPLCRLEQKMDKTKTENIVFRSTDGGQTWQDISEGLPKPVQDDYGVGSHGFFSNEDGLYISTGNGTYYSKVNATAPFWNQAPLWINGNTWNQGNTGGGSKVVEANGVKVATSNMGITRSTDGGKTWSLIISEGGVGIDVACLKGGFAAITYSSALNVRRIRTSYDGGKTWQPIDAGLPASLSIASIIQVGENFFCGHPDGIYKSADKGKTWKLLLPAINGKVFNLRVSGNIIYAIPRNGGC